MGGELAFGLLSVGSLGLLYLAASLASGNGVLGLPATPALAAVSVMVAIVLAPGSAGAVGPMLWIANSRLRGFQGSIVTHQSHTSSTTSAANYASAFAVT